MDDGVEEGLRGAEPGEAVERVAAEEIDVAGGADTRRLSRAVRDASRDAGGVWRVLTVLGSLQTWRGSDGAGGRVGGEWWRRIRCDVLRLGRCGRADRRRASVGEVCIDYIRARARARRRGSRKQWELLTQTVGFRGGPPRKDGWDSRAGRGSPWARRQLQEERGARGVREPSRSEAQERADRPGHMRSRCRRRLRSRRARGGATRATHASGGRVCAGPPLSFRDAQWPAPKLDGNRLRKGRRGVVNVREPLILTF